MIVDSHLLIDIDCIGQSIEIDSNNFFRCYRYRFYRFNDTIDFMIFHCPRGSKPNNVLKNEPLPKNLRTASDWLYHVLVMLFLFSFIIYFVMHIYRMILMMLCNMIFEEERILLTNCTLNSILTT